MEIWASTIHMSLIVGSPDLGQLVDQGLVKYLWRNSTLFGINSFWVIEIEFEWSIYVNYPKGKSLHDSLAPIRIF